MRRVITAVLAALLLSLFTAGCSSSWSFKWTAPAPSPKAMRRTWELVDLTAARDAGAITEQEYQSLKSKLESAPLE